MHTYMCVCERRWSTFSGSAGCSYGTRKRINFPPPQHFSHIIFFGVWEWVRSGKEVKGLSWVEREEGMRYVKCEMVNLNSRKVLGDVVNETCRLLFNFLMLLISILFKWKRIRLSRKWFIISMWSTIVTCFN